MPDRPPFLQFRPHYSHDGLRLLNLHIVTEENEVVGQIPAMDVSTTAPGGDIARMIVTVGGHRCQRATYEEKPVRA